MRVFILFGLLLAAACVDISDKEHAERLDLCYGLTVEQCDAIRSADDDRDGVVAEEDCDDQDASRHPGASELCDGKDNDCDNIVDEDAIDASIWYPDFDADSYGVDGPDNQIACDQPDGFAGVAGDCDDGDAAYNPGALEEDCSDPSDYNCDGYSGAVDNDNDDVAACEGDCDDSDATINPEALEVVGDEIDEDCDGNETCYTNVDDDGYRTAIEVSSSDVDCDDDGEATSSLAGEDCDDIDHTINPGAAEVCDDIDNDCDGTVDVDAIDASVYYADNDGDGYGDDNKATEALCPDDAGDYISSGYVTTGGDCNDGNGDIYTDCP